MNPLSVRQTGFANDIILDGIPCLLMAEKRKPATCAKCKKKVEAYVVEDGEHVCMECAPLSDDTSSKTNA